MKFSSFMNSKKNSCRGNYMRKYGIYFFTSDLMKVVRSQKQPSEAKKGIKELIY